MFPICAIFLPSFVLVNCVLSWPQFVLITEISFKALPSLLTLKNGWFFHIIFLCQFLFPPLFQHQFLLILILGFFRLLSVEKIVVHNSTTLFCPWILLRNIFCERIFWTNFPAAFGKRKSLVLLQISINFILVVFVLILIFDHQIFFIVTHHHPKRFLAFLPKCKWIICWNLTFLVLLRLCFGTERMKIGKRIDKMFSEIVEILSETNLSIVKCFAFIVLDFESYFWWRNWWQVYAEILHNKIMLRLILLSLKYCFRKVKRAFPFPWIWI